MKAITCRKCNGKGKVPVPKALQEVVIHVRKWRTASGVLSAMLARGRPINFSAVSMRLEKCRKLGLVERRNGGRAWEYQAL